MHLGMGTPVVTPTIIAEIYRCLCTGTYEIKAEDDVQIVGNVTYSQTHREATEMAIVTPALKIIPEVKYVEKTKTQVLKKEWYKNLADGEEAVDSESVDSADNDVAPGTGLMPAAKPKMSSDLKHILVLSGLEKEQMKCLKKAGFTGMDNLHGLTLNYFETTLRPKGVTMESFLPLKKFQMYAVEFFLAQKKLPVVLDIEAQEWAQIQRRDYNTALESDEISDIPAENDPWEDSEGQYREYFNKITVRLPPY